MLVLGLVIWAIVWLEPAQPVLSGHGARASDGDSLRLAGQRIRIIGIDAPELDQTCTDADGSSWHCGRAARDRLAELLAGASLDCRPDGRDRYGRVLATCFRGDADIGRLMVVEGMAVSSGAYGPEELEARRQGRGIWAGTFERPRDWRDGQDPTPWEWFRDLLG